MMLFCQWVLLVMTAVRLLCVMVLQGEKKTVSWDAKDVLYWMIGALLLFGAGAFNLIF